MLLRVAAMCGCCGELVMLAAHCIRLSILRLIRTPTDPVFSCAGHGGASARQPGAGARPLCAGYGRAAAQGACACAFEDESLPQPTAIRRGYGCFFVYSVLSFDLLLTSSCAARLQELAMYVQLLERSVLGSQQRKPGADVDASVFTDTQVGRPCAVKRSSNGN